MKTLLPSQLIAAIQFQVKCEIENNLVLGTLLREPKKQYKIRKEAKKSGGFRTIRAPFGSLKKVQSATKLEILDKLEVSPIAHAYTRGRGIDTNASAHIGSHSMVEFDLKSAYDSTSLHAFFKHRDCRTYQNELLQLLDFDPALVVLLMELVDFEDEKEHKFLLPQGTPTSPALFNLICRAMDDKLIELAIHRGGTVTRYADNIFFSLPDQVFPYEIMNAIRRIIEKSGFTVNPDKTKRQNYGNRLGVPLRFPGINLMEDELYIPRAILRRLRAKCFNAGKEYAINAWLPKLAREIQQTLDDEGVLETDEFLRLLGAEQAQEKGKKRKDPAAVAGGIKGYSIQTSGKWAHQLNREFQHGVAYITGGRRI